MLSFSTEQHGIEGAIAFDDVVDRFHETNRFKFPGPHPCVTAPPLRRDEVGENADMIRTSETLV